MLTEFVVYRSKTPPFWVTSCPVAFEGVFHAHLPVWLDVEDWCRDAARWGFIWKVVSPESPEALQRNLMGMIEWGMEGQILAWLNLKTQPILDVTPKSLLDQFNRWIAMEHPQGHPWSPKQWNLVKLFNLKTPLGLKIDPNDWDNIPGMENISEFYN